MPVRKPKPLAGDALLEHGVRLLSGRAHSIGEVRQKLRRRAADPGDVEMVVGKLKELGYLDDQRFAEGFATARRENEGFGERRVLRDLRQRRVAPKLAEEITRKAYAETDEAALIESFLERKYRGKDLHAWLGEQKNLLSAYRRLLFAGFSPRNSIEALKRHAREAAALEGMEEEPEEIDSNSEPTA